VLFSANNNNNNKMKRSPQQQQQPTTTTTNSSFMLSSSSSAAPPPPPPKTNTTSKRRRKIDDDDEPADDNNNTTTTTDPLHVLSSAVVASMASSSTTTTTDIPSSKRTKQIESSMETSTTNNNSNNNNNRHRPSSSLSPSKRAKIPSPNINNNNTTVTPPPPIHHPLATTTSTTSGAQPRSPRSQEIRERNREAVRKCREKKRAEVISLKDRVDQLKKENASLRTMLELGEESSMKQLRGKEMVQEIITALQNKDEKLPSLVHAFIEGYVETGKDKTAQLSFLIGRLHRMFAPENVSLRYLSIISSGDEELDEELWKEFRSVVNLTPEQETKLRARKVTGKRTLMETKYVLETFRAIAMQMNQRKSLSEAFHTLPTKTITALQFAKFLSWVHRDPFSTDLLDAAWNQLQIKIDAENEVIIAARDTNANISEVKKLLDLVRLENRNLMKKLFMETDYREKERLAHRVFEDNVVIIDPSNGGEFRGMANALKYVNKIQKSFTNIETGEMSLVMMQKNDAKSGVLDGDRSLTKWFLYGMYSGKLLQGSGGGGGGPSTPTTSSSNSSSNSNSSNHTMKIDTPRQQYVEMEVVISATFAKDGDRMKELVISTDLVGLLRSLKSTSTSIATSNSDETITLLHDIRKLFEGNNSSTTTLSSSKFSIDQNQARQLLSPRCIFEDSNMSCESKGIDDCIAYVELIRSAFPKFSVQSHTDSKLEDGTLQSIWSVQAAYGGALARSTPDQARPCYLKVTMFIKTDDEDPSRVAQLKMSWDAASLFKQLGLQ
jgi:hypothetical protein